MNSWESAVFYSRWKVGPQAINCKANLTQRITIPIDFENDGPWGGKDHFKRLGSPDRAFPKFRVKKSVTGEFYVVQKRLWTDFLVKIW